MKTKVNNSETSKNQPVKPSNNDSKGQEIIISQKANEDEGMIDSIEQSLNQELTSVDAEIAKLNNKKQNIGSLNDVLTYWKSTMRALTILENEEVNVTVKVTVGSGDEVVSLQSNKIETVKSVIKLLSDSSKERMQALIDADKQK